MESPFQYRRGKLHADKVDLSALAAETGTPFYCYSASHMRTRFKALKAAFKGMNPLIAFAMKANSNQAVLTLFGKLGAGADVVSLGELERAVAAGIAPRKIVFSGVGKTEAEMRRGLELGIHCFNLESEPELARLNRVAGELGVTAPVSVRINPDVDAKTHAKISTGKSENKFGIPFAEATRVYSEIAAAPHLNAIGVDMHIGSQLTNLEPFGNAFALLAELIGALKAGGHKLKHVDIGGGLGVAYEPLGHTADLDAYAAMVRRHLGPLGLKLVLEPGRWLVADAGALVTKVEYVKQGPARNFVIVDAAMNDLIRPTLYEAFHEVRPVTQTSEAAPHMTADIVGPVCETGDYLALSRDVPALNSGDLLAVMSAGAYGAVMAGTYNTRPLIAEVMVDGSQSAIIRRRGTIEEMIARDSVPDWM